jgi:hypothetical protein
MKNGTYRQLRPARPSVVQFDAWGFGGDAISISFCGSGFRKKLDRSFDDFQLVPEKRLSL